MLQTYPARLLDFAIDGVIRSVSLHQVADEQAQLAYARHHAARERDEARAEAGALRATAAQEGFHVGLVQALACLVPLLETLRDQQAALAAAVAGELDRVLQSMSVAPDIVAEQVRVALQARLAAQPEVRAILHLPRTETALLAALRDAPGLAGLELRAAERRTPLLEMGALAWELDLAAALEEDCSRALAQAMPGLEDALSALASRYGTQLVTRLQRAAEARGFAMLKEEE